jgi:hypothetical protein
MPAAMTMMTILQCSGMCYTSQDDKGKSIGSPFHSPSKDVQIMKCQTLFAVMIVLTLAGLSVAAEKAKTPAKEQGIVHTVTASMDYPTAGGVGIQAEKRPGEFKIPKGSKGAKLKYQFFNPKSGNTLTKLTGNSIYSVTEKRYMHELDKNPDFELPAGDYKFVVGGEPGATGTLTYTTIPSTGDETTTTTRPPKDTTKATTKDKSKTGTEPAPLHPGGEGKKKVTVDFFEAQRTCKLDAWLTIDNNKITLDFIVPDLQDEFSITKATSRWEGTLEKKAKGTTASGKTNFENVTNYKSGKVARLKMKGTFTATLEGNVLTGSIEDHGQLEAAEGGGGPIDSKARWRINDFAP